MGNQPSTKLSLDMEFKKANSPFVCEHRTINRASRRCGKWAKETNNALLGRATLLRLYSATQIKMTDAIEKRLIFSPVAMVGSHSVQPPLVCWKLMSRNRRRVYRAITSNLNGSQVCNTQQPWKYCGSCLIVFYGNVLQFFVSFTGFH